MHNNGVTHSTVCDDFEGVFTVLQWLSYMPKVSPSLHFCHSLMCLLYPIWIIFNEVFLWNLYISFSWSCLLPSAFRIPLDLTKPRCFLATDMFMAYICSHPQILRLPHPYEFPSCSKPFLLQELASQRARAQWSQCTTVSGFKMRIGNCACSLTHNVCFSFDDRDRWL